MKGQKRVLKGYKVADITYQKAKKRAVKNKGSLATLLEYVVIAYSGGFDIKATMPESEIQTDLFQSSKIKSK